MAIQLDHMDNQIVEFRPLTEGDLPLLLDWLNRPHLQKWWRSGEMSLEDVQEKYLPRIFGADDARPFFAYINGEPVGYIQYYVATEGNNNWWPDDPGPDVLGIDQFLADGERLGEGLGVTMISAFITFLMTILPVSEIRVDPHPDNHRAIRCYLKLGFRQVAPITTPDGPAILMIFESPPNQQSSQE